MPLVRKALVAAAEARLEGVAAPLALKVVEEILQDADAPKAVKAKLALGVLDRVRGKDEKGQAGHKTLQDMTVAELASHVRRLEELQAGEANLLDVTPGKQGTGEATP